MVQRKLVNWHHHGDQKEGSAGWNLATGNNPGAYNTAAAASAEAR